jgi:hypothetical protein
MCGGDVTPYSVCVKGMRRREEEEERKRERRGRGEKGDKEVYP